MSVSTEWAYVRGGLFIVATLLVAAVVGWGVYDAVHQDSIAFKLMTNCLLYEKHVALEESADPIARSAELGANVANRLAVAEEDLKRLDAALPARRATLERLAARPDASSLTPRIDSAYQKAILVDANAATSRQWHRGIRIECPCTRAISAKTARPPIMVALRKVKTGKSVTPIFMIGQLTPQMRVSRHSRKTSRRDSVFDILL